MRFRRKRWPQLGELVLCTVKKITRVAAFVELDEYENKEGMIHITEVSSRIVRNIKEYLEEGQKVIAKVIRVFPERSVLDLSLKRVRESERRRKSEEIRKEKKAEKIIELFCEKKGLNPDEFFEKYFRKIKEDGYIYEIFELAAEEGIKHLKFLPEDIREEFYEIVKKEFEKAAVEMRWIINAFSFEGDGVKRIRDFFDKAYKMLKDFEFVFQYQGAPKYLLIVKSKKPKEDEKKIEKTLKKLEKIAKELNIECSFERLRKWQE